MKFFSFLRLHSLILLSCASLAYSAEMWLYCGSLNNYTTTDLEDPLPLMSNTCYDEELLSIFYTFGYNTSPTDEITTVVIQSYITVGGFNVFLINWEKEAESGSPLTYGVNYLLLALPNVKKVAKKWATALTIMTQNTLDLDKTILEGHSLGAHVAGYTGTYVQDNGLNVSRVIGMDPAGPGYEGPISMEGLKPSCAKFVVAYHTNKVFGNVNSLGQVDIWFNCNKAYQPRCANESILLERDRCSHSSINYYVAEATLNATAFAAAPSKSCSSWVAQGDTTAQLIYVGVNIDPETRGNYYLTTNAVSPYGRGAAGAVYST